MPPLTLTSSRRGSLAAGALLLALFVAGSGDAPAASAPLHGSAPVGIDATMTAGAASTTATAAATKAMNYRTLKQLGVTASSARLSGKVVQVKLKNRRKVEIRLAVIRDRQRKLQAWDAVVLKPGSRTLTRRLNTTPRGSNLNLRVTARIGRVRARGIISLQIVPPTPPPPPPGPSNSPPTAIGLSNAAVVENQPAGTTVGSLSATDPNPGDTPSFALVPGAGGDDNAAFTIAGTTLRTAAAFDFEAKSSHAIRVRVSDGKGGSFEMALTIAVTDANDAPSNIALSHASVAENQAAGTAVGTLSFTDQDAADTPAFSLVSGPGSADNASFTIAGTQLQTTAAFNLEAKSSYSIRVQATDVGGATFERQFTVTVSNVNETPTDIALASASVPENQPSGTTVGALSAVDPDAGDSASFTLVTGTGDADNASFQIFGGTLQTGAALDFEVKSSYSIRVRTLDADGLSFEKQLTITVTNVSEPPTDIVLSNASVAENQPAGTTVGALSAVDPDAGETYGFTLVSGTGDADNASFQISGGTLQTNAVFDLETKSSYTVRIRVVDGNGGFFEKQVAVMVSDTNDVPTDIALSNASVAENLPPGTLVGLLSGTDADPLDTLSFSLIAGTGDANNASFQVSGTMLQTTAAFDLETKSSYSIRLRLSDGNGGTFDEQFTISVSNVNEAPTEIALSAATVAENQPSGTTVGSLSATDPDAGDAATFTLVAGSGDGDNASFQISGGTLQTSAAFDFETKFGYSVRVRATDAGTLSFEKQFTISVTNAAEPPTDIALSNASVAENQPTATAVGTLSSTDPDAGETDTFTLVAGTGDTDNASFQISGATLQTNAVFDFETKSSYSIRVHVSDGNGGTFDKQLTIAVTNANDTPTDIALSNASTAENQPPGTLVGVLSGTDQDPLDTLTFSLVAGTGDTDNAAFQVSGSMLQSAASLDFETKSSYAIRLRVSDGAGGTFEEQFTVTVTDVNDAPTNVALSPSSVDEGQPSGTTVGTLSATDADQPADTFTFTLVAGTGDADNASFQISGSTLQTAAVLDFNAGASRAIRVSVSDGDGGTFEKQLTVTIGNVNQAPTDIALSNATVAENALVNTTVGTLSGSDADAGDTLTFSLVAGAGSTDNASFNIAGTALRTSAVFDFETKSSYSIRVQVSDSVATFEEQLTVTVTNANEAPTDIALGTSSVDENTAAGTAVGTLSSSDPDAGATHTYTLVAGTGDTDNAKFQIVGNALQRSAAGLDFETTPTVTVRIRTTDNGGLTFEEAFTITVVDVNEAPVADDETFSGNDSAHGNTTMVGDDDSDGAPNPSEPKTTISANILAGDQDVDGPGPLTVTPGTFDTNLLGKVTLEADGDFTYRPPASTSCSNPTDFFTYTVEDSGSPELTDTGQVNIALGGCVWYVNNSFSGSPDNLGTSQAPFNSLAQAETASDNGHTVFVFDGDNTSTGYDDATGYQMNSGERLIGEHEGLVVDGDGGGSQTPDTLRAANAGAHPAITADNADVISLDDGNEIRGINVDPQNTGGGIAGGAGDTGGGTISSVNVVDTGTIGSQPGLELNGTTGTFNISDFTVDNDATGVLLNNAGTVDFAGDTSPVTLDSNGGPALNATGATSMGTSTIDDIVVTNSGTGGVIMDTVSGTTVLGDGSGTDLNLTTTSGATPALDLNSPGAVTVGSAGTDDLHATGGPAIDVTSATNPTLNLDDVDSTNSANDAINLDGLGTGTFSAASGDVGGYSGIGFDLNAGSGSITYPGNLNNASGATAVEISGRTGGVISLSGPITDTSDAGGGVSVTSNTGGSTVLSGATKQFNTGASDAVTFASSDGHTLALAGGGSDIDTTSANGVNATTSGTLQFSGSGNTIDSSSLGAGNRALNVSDTDIAAADITFQRISATNGINAIRLNNTGTAGNLAITGTGANDSGGTMTNQTGNAVDLTGTDNLNVDELNIQNPARDGFSGSNVTNFTVTDSTIHNAGQSDADITDSAFAFNTTASANENNIDGTIVITGNTITSPYGSGLDIFNHNGTISDLNVSSNTITSGTIPGANPGTGDDDSNEDAIQVVAFGGPGFAANLTKATVSNNSITGFPDGEGIVFLGGSQGTTLGTMGTPGSATDKITISGNDADGHSGANPMLTSFITADVEGRARGHFVITGNGTAGDPMTNVAGQAIAVGGAGGDLPAGQVELELHVTNNFAVPNSGSGSSGIGLGTDKDTIADATVLSDFDVNAEISSNYVNDSHGPGIRVLHRDSNDTLNLRLNNNTVDSPTQGGHGGIRIDHGSSGSASFDPTICMQMTGNDADAGPADGFGDVRPGIVILKRGTATTYDFGIVGLSPDPANAAQTESFVAGINTASIGAGDPLFAGKEAVVQVGNNFTGCALPAF